MTINGVQGRGGIGNMSRGVVIKMSVHVPGARRYNRSLSRGDGTKHKRVHVFRGVEACYSKEDIVKAVDLVKHPSEVLLRCVVLTTKLCPDILND